MISKSKTLQLSRHLNKRKRKEHMAKIGNKHRIMMLMREMVMMMVINRQETIRGTYPSGKVKRNLSQYSTSNNAVAT